jgi:hypothetical protein
LDELGSLVMDEAGSLVMDETPEKLVLTIEPQMQTTETGSLTEKNSPDHWATSTAETVSLVMETPKKPVLIFEEEAQTAEMAPWAMDETTSLRENRMGQG